MHLRCWLYWSAVPLHYRHCWSYRAYSWKWFTDSPSSERFLSVSCVANNFAPRWVRCWRNRIIGQEIVDKQPTHLEVSRSAKNYSCCSKFCSATSAFLFPLHSLQVIVSRPCTGTFQTQPCLLVKRALDQLWFVLLAVLRYIILCLPRWIVKDSMLQK